MRSVIDTAQNRTTDLVTRITELKNEAQDTVGAIGEKATTYAYEKQASDEEDAADNGRTRRSLARARRVVALAAISSSTTRG